MKKFIVAAIAATVLVGPMAGVTWATEEPCVPKDAYTTTVADGFQRYSWTGGPHESDNAPDFPSEDWQANVEGDPHGVGVAGAYYRSNGNSGKGDWFYLETVVKIIEHPAVTCPTPTPEPTPEPPVVTPEPPVVEEPNVEVPEVKPELGTGVQRPAQPVDEETTELPATGAEQTAGILLGALFLLAGGTAAVWFYRNR